MAHQVSRIEGVIVNRQPVESRVLGVPPEPAQVLHAGIVRSRLETEAERHGSDLVGAERRLVEVDAEAGTGRHLEMPFVAD